MENRESFLDILNDYFSKLTEEQKIEGAGGNITIPIEWIDTGDNYIDRDVIEQAFINMICLANPSYKARLKSDKEYYNKIDIIEIVKAENGINFVVYARDSGNQTKLVITKDHSLKGPFWRGDEEKLYKEVLRAYDYKSATHLSRNPQVREQFHLGETELKKVFFENFEREEVKQKREERVHQAMITAAQKIVRNYHYMHMQKVEYESQRGIIEQETAHRGNINLTPSENGIKNDRVSDIYEFQQRKNVFAKMNPSYIVNIDNIEEGTINQNAYATYIYPNPRGKEGYLFIAEPSEGDSSTRVKFVPQEEYDALQLEEGQDKFVYLAEEITRSSRDSFVKEKYAKTFNHTSIEKFEEKFRRIVLGEEVDKNAEARYAEIDSIIFDGKRKISKEQIRGMAEIIPINGKDGLNNARIHLYGGKQINQGIGEQVQ